MTKYSTELKIKGDEKFSKAPEKEYQRTLKEIDNRINWWIGKFADDNVISVEQAKKIVAEADINELKEKAKEYVKNKDLSTRANKEMRIYNLKMKIARDELLQKYIDLERQSGVLSENLISDKKIKTIAQQIVNDSHTIAHFSDYIWTNLKELRNDLQNGLNRSILRGQNPNVWKKDLYKHFKGRTQKAEFAARRLAVTETAIAQTKAGLISAKENGYDKVIVITELGACKDCKPHDGDIVDIDEAKMGDNVPIWHPFCRCTVAAYYEYEEDRLLIESDAKSVAQTEMKKVQNYEPYITQDLKMIAKKHESKLVGLEYRMKSEDSLVRKIISDAQEKEVTIEVAAKEINDKLRYTFVNNYDIFTDSYFSLIDELEKGGYNTIRVKNTFADGNTYKGINTLVKRNNDVIFELQYHTPKSYEVKEGILHELYEKQRTLDKKKDFELWGQLEKEMIKASSEIINPKGVERIK